MASSRCCSSTAILPAVVCGSGLPGTSLLMRLRVAAGPIMCVSPPAVSGLRLQRSELARFRPQVGAAGEDIDGLKAHEIIPGPVAVRVGGEAIRMPEPGILQVVADAPGVRELRLLHLARDVTAKRRFRLPGEVVTRLLQHSLPDGHQLVELVGGEVEVVRDPGTHPRVGSEELTTSLSRSFSITWSSMSIAS